MKFEKMQNIINRILKDDDIYFIIDDKMTRLIVNHKVFSESLNNNYRDLILIAIANHCNYTFSFSNTKKIVDILLTEEKHKDIAYHVFHNRIEVYSMLNKRIKTTQAKSYRELVYMIIEKTLSTDTNDNEKVTK